jgi:hypothetical protein
VILSLKAKIKLYQTAFCVSGGVFNHLFKNNFIYRLTA